MNFLSLTYGLLPMMVIIIMGFYAKRKLITKDEIWAGMEKISFNIFMPALLIKELSKADIHNIPIDNIALALFGAVLSILIIMVFLYPLYRGSKANRATYSSLFQTSIRFNFVIALSLFSSFSNQDALALLVFAILMIVPFNNTIVVGMMAWLLTDGKISPLSIFLQIIKNPLIIGSLVGLAVAISGIEIPFIVGRLFSILGDSAFSLILLSIGAGLSFSRLKDSRRDLYISIFLKLFLMPAIATFIALAVGLRDSALISCVIIAAMPTAINGYILARQMGGDAPLYANIASVQNLLSFITLPAWIVFISIINDTLTV